MCFAHRIEPLEELLVGFLLGKGRFYGLSHLLVEEAVCI